MSKKSLHVLSVCLLVLTLSLAAVAATSTAGETALTKESVKDILKEIAPDANVLSVEMSPIEGLWEVAVSGSGGKGVFYIDTAKKYLFQGSMIDLATKTNLTKAKFEEINKVDVSKVPLQDSLIIGDPKAKNRIIVFTDPDCPYCARFNDEIKKVIEKRKDIVFYVKLFPLSIHPKAHDKAVAIECEKDNDKAVKMLDDAYAKKDIPKASCNTTGVDENIKLAESLGLNGTPTVIFADGNVKNGMSADDIMKQVDNQKL